MTTVESLRRKIELKRQYIELINEEIGELHDLIIEEEYIETLEDKYE